MIVFGFLDLILLLLSFPILTYSFNAYVKVRCLETFQKECSERQRKTSQSQCKVQRYNDRVSYIIVHHSMHTSDIIFKDEYKSVSDIDDFETASNITGISQSNTSIFSSFDRKPQYFADLVKSSQELLSDTVNNCYGSLNGIQQRVNHNCSSSLFETQWTPMCSTCHVHQAAFSLVPCCHYVCNLCYQIRFRPPADFDVPGGELLNTCDVCFKVSFISDNVITMQRN